MRKMHADLMRATRLQLYIDVGERRETLFDRIVRHRGFAVLLHAHALSIHRVARNRLIDRSATGQHAVANREVVSGNLPVCQEAHERRVRGQCLADQQQAACILVQPMNNARARNLLKRGDVVQQAVHQGTRGIASAGMHNQPCRLVDHQQVLVFVRDLKSNWLWFGRDADLCLRLHGHRFAARHGIPRLFGPAFDGDRASQEPLLQAAARILRKHSCKRLVQPEAGKLGWNSGNLFFDAHDWTIVYGILADLEAALGAAAASFKDDSMQFISVLNPVIMRQARLLTVVLVSGALAACAGKDEVRTEVQNITEAYELAQQSIERNNFRKGIQIFEAIQARYPFSEISRQIQLELLHAYFKSGQYEQAVEAADTFMRENPTHLRVDYALYIKALCYFERDAGILERWFKRDVTKRPPNDTDLAYSTLRRLVERYPSSEYAADAEQRMLAIKERMAAYENYVADYYLRRGAYVAAVNRAKGALEEYNGASSNAESLRIMAEAYDNLGMSDLATDARKVLQANFPGEG